MSCTIIEVVPLEIALQVTNGGNFFLRISEQVR